MGKCQRHFAKMVINDDVRSTPPEKLLLFSWFSFGFWTGNLKSTKTLSILYFTLIMTCYFGSHDKHDCEARSAEESKH